MIKENSKILFLDIDFLKDSKKVWRIVKARGIVNKLSAQSDRLLLKIETIEEFIVYPNEWMYTVNLFAYSPDIDVYVIEKGSKNLFLIEELSSKTVILEDLFRSENKKDIKDFHVSDLVNHDPPKGYSEFESLYNIVAYFSNRNNLILDFANAEVKRESRIKRYFYSRDIENIDIPMPSLYKGIRRLLSLDKN